jgi:ribosomal protein S18 acetylase RimI-like enzyme
VEAARPATQDDVPRLAELNRQALADMAAFRGGVLYAIREARDDPFEDDFARAVADADQCVLVGTVDDVPLGYAVAATEVLRDGSRLGRITDLFVESEARGVGVGEALMDALLAWFGAQRCAGVDAIALPGDRTTKNFFEGSGFTARLLVMHHRMAED